jgi:uncharacterized protein (DUF433 family)
MTRIAVWVLEEARRAGVGDLDLLKDYPGLSVFDLEASQPWEAEPVSVDPETQRMMDQVAETWQKIRR